MIRVEVVMGWPRRFRSVLLELGDGASVQDAIAAAGLDAMGDVVGYAIHGLRAELRDQVRDGDRIELLRGLQADPKDARRKRAASSPKP